MTVANVEKHVRERYSEGAKTRVEELCCPVDYDPRYLEIIPAEVIERDYGCGDPSKHLAPARRCSISAAARARSASSPRRWSAPRGGSSAST